ncbi:hypothetical protein A0O34_15930 [Chryseobacterium glaciei]|uniref:Uncharacterized protein n=1 Tax=Chryseobacterium glaciei TaxID=1685010 RepID=A0A172XY42_9FLAO|nr:hypothetical protein [Chryseobacterium glaciei]ANF51908.1 hypothetical protein A0O34_15930 [Chryseobacterium glaciei]
METEKLIKQLTKIAEETSYYARIRRSPSSKKKEKEDAIEMLSTLSENTVSLFKQHNLLDLIQPKRDKLYDKQWYEETFGNGAVTDINNAIIELKKIKANEAEHSQNNENQ